jgi:hypothetical protein
MDTEIEDLKQEVAELKEVVADTNKTLHGMRRSQRWGTIFRIVWWLTIVGVTGAAYYYFVQPYVEQVMSTYDNAKDFQVQIQDWFAQFGRTDAQ